MHSSLTTDALAGPGASQKRSALQHALQRHFQAQTKPPGSLGQIERLGEQIALLQNTLSPSVERTRICVFAGSHGIAHEGVSAFPAEVTAQMVANFLSGGAAVCVLARAANASLHIIDCGVEGLSDPSHEGSPGFFARSQRRGTRSFLRDKAMTESECAGAMEAGREQVRLALLDGIEALALGEMGIGNSTSASALCAALLDMPVEAVTGRGTGVNDEGLTHKRQVIQSALSFHAREDAAVSARHWLEAVGGFEIAAMTGAILEATAHCLPIVVDGFISTAAAVVAFAMEPRAREVCIFAHQSDEHGHRIVLERLGVTPLLSLGMRLGEGSGAALALPLLKAAARLVREMATFDSAGVSRSSQPSESV